MTCLEKNQEVVDQIGCLARQRPLVLADAGTHRLQCLLAQLARASRRSRIEELTRVGSPGILRAPLPDRRGQPSKYIFAHWRKLQPRRQIVSERRSARQGGDVKRRLPPGADRIAM